MNNKKEIAPVIYIIIILLITFLTPFVYDSKVISDSIKNLYGIFAKGCGILAFVVYAFTMIKKK